MESDIKSQSELISILFAAVNQWFIN